MPADARLVRQETPADFTLYLIAWQGAEYSIYEGDWPQERIGSSGVQRLPLDENAILTIAEENSTLLIDMREDGGRYLDILGTCRDIADCPLADFAMKITARPD